MSPARSRARLRAGSARCDGRVAAGLPDPDRSPSVHPVLQTLDAFAFGAVIAAEERAAFLEAVAEDAAAAVLAARRQRLDRTLEAVERVRPSIHRHLKRLVVVVAAGFAGRHGITSR